MLTRYESQVVESFKRICSSKGSASAAEVCEDMSRRHVLSSMDSTIDIADIMKSLRGRGEL